MGWGTSLTQYRKRELPARHPWCSYSAMAHRVTYAWVDTHHECRIAFLAPVLTLSRQSVFGSVATNVLHYLDSKIGTSLFVEIRGHYLNLLSPCLFLKPYIKAEMMQFASSLSVWSDVPQLPEVMGAVQVLFSLVFISIHAFSAERSSGPFVTIGFWMSRSVRRTFVSWGVENGCCCHLCVRHFYRLMYIRR